MKTLNYDRVADCAWQKKSTMAYYSKHRNSKQNSLFRRLVLARDKKKCAVCYSKSNLHVHHLDTWQSDPIKRFKKDNGITLCAKCHRNLHLWVTKKSVKAQQKLIKAMTKPPSISVPMDTDGVGDVKADNIGTEQKSATKAKGRTVLRRI